MATITIPHNISSQDELVVISRKEYEQIKNQIMPTIYLQGKAARKLDRRVEQGLKEYREGKTEPLESFLKREYSRLSKRYAD